MEKYKTEYPFISQVIRNAFGIESVYLAFPYQNARQADHGFRELVWMDYDMAEDIASFSRTAGCYSMYIVQSALEFINIACMISPGNQPDVIAFGPFSPEAFSAARIQQIMQKQKLPRQHQGAIADFYNRLPVAVVANVVSTIQHLITNFLPEFNDAEIVYLDYAHAPHTTGTAAQTYAAYSAHAAERYNRHIQEYLNAVSAGDIGSASSALKFLLSDLTSGPSAALQTLKKEFSAVNLFCCQRILSTTVHPYYVFQQMNETGCAIDSAASRDELVHIAHHLTRKYCLLVKNYALAEYSCLVRGMINYIDQHITDSLTLSDIAGHFGKNSSYVSGLFNREVGVSLTTYIHQERIRRAIRYMNTTQMSISEISHAVGIDDFAYFSRIFKKQVGTSPSEYRKMLHRS